MGHLLPRIGTPLPTDWDTLYHEMEHPYPQVGTPFTTNWNTLTHRLGHRYPRTVAPLTTGWNAGKRVRTGTSLTRVGTSLTTDWNILNHGLARHATLLSGQRADLCACRLCMAWGRCGPVVVVVVVVVADRLSQRQPSSQTVCLSNQSLNARPLDLQFSLSL